jgi:electron transfer flavoprotein beta subunit
MEILVCIKRVPTTGAKIVLTEDARAIDTRNLGFTISPHEECAVEAAVQLVEKHGGSVTVLTLGGAEATQQIRDALAVGADKGILLETDGTEWDPMATANAIVHAVNSADEAFDLLFFGHEAADSGDYQVGVRVAYALDLPCVAGVKGLAIVGETAVAKRESSSGYELYELALPAVLTLKEGLNLPRYPSVPGKLRAKKKPLKTITPQKMGGGLELVKLVTPPEQSKSAEVLGMGVAAVPKIIELLRELKFVE